MEIGPLHIFYPIWGLTDFQSFSTNPCKCLKAIMILLPFPQSRFFSSLNIHSSFFPLHGFQHHQVLPLLNQSSLLIYSAKTPLVKPSNTKYNSLSDPGILNPNHHVFKAQFY